MKKLTCFAIVLIFILVSCKKDEEKPKSQEVSEPIYMVLVKGGTFQMGNINGSSLELPVHPVTLSSFYISKTEVTQKQWSDVMGTKPSNFVGDNLPVEKVSWNDAQIFITELNRQTKKNYRLPTEAEWEFASKGGISSKGYTYSGGNTLGEVAWYVDNSSRTTHAVATKKANELGLYDLTGNVSEWCSDWYASYSSEVQTDPTGPNSGFYRVIRGSSWGAASSYCNVTNREGTMPEFKFSNLGFRLALSL